jgi:hypothetical protein
MGNRPFWQHHPDPAMRVPWQVRLGVKTELEMYDLRPKYICPHCGHQGLLSTNTIFKHFGYCDKRDKTMSKEQIQEILDADVKPIKKYLCWFQWLHLLRVVAIMLLSVEEKFTQTPVP